MAAGDITYRANTKTTNGKFHQISGTAEVDGTSRAFDLFPGGYIVPGTFTIFGQDDAGAVEVDVNVNASGSDDAGNVVLQSATTDVNTYEWSCSYIS
jgi:hypothetical protein|tara:strand:+ start:8850 stop:9140 length:291 start_codon:yes stop_codon:yes gene_type:complete